MAAHIYRLKDGTRVPGVTTILGNLGWKTGGLVDWAHKLGLEGVDYRAARDSAADSGTLAHSMVEANIHGRDFSPGIVDAVALQQAELAYHGFTMWAQQSRLQMLATEVSMVSEQARFGGTLDAIGLVAGQLSLIDWKSSNAVYAEYLCQLAAYRYLWNETCPDLPLTGGFHLCRFAKDGAGFRHWWIPEEALSPAWRVFQSLLTIHDTKKTLERLAK